MRSFNRSLGVALLATIALQGCSTNPSVSGGESIQEFSRGLSGKRFEFIARPSVFDLPSRSGKPVTAQRMPQGLIVALEPARKLCVRDGGGELIFSHMLEAGVGTPLPQRIVCQRGPAPLWALFITFADVKHLPYNGGEMRMTLHTGVLSAEQYVVELQEEKAREQAQAEAREKAAAAQRERQAAFERERPQRIAQAQQAALEQLARVGAFQANLKAGSKVKWAPPAGIIKYSGIVVRVEDSLALVQLDRPPLSGQQTLYIKKSELEPLD